MCTPNMVHASSVSRGRHRYNTFMNAGNMVVPSGLECEIVAPDICSCLKCEEGICMFRYFRASKWLQNLCANVNLFPGEQETDNFTHDGMIREEKQVGVVRAAGRERYIRLKKKEREKKTEGESKEMAAYQSTFSDISN